MGFYGKHFFFIFKNFVFTILACHINARAIAHNTTNFFITRQTPTTSQATVCFRFFWLRINNIATILQNFFVHFTLFI